METTIDVGFDFRTDTPPGKDADLLSPTLREYHRRLWSKQLPTGHTFTLTQGENAYLLHESSLGRFALSSDAITTRLKMPRPASTPNSVAAAPRRTGSSAMPR